MVQFAEILLATRRGAGVAFAVRPARNPSAEMVSGVQGGPFRKDPATGRISVGDIEDLDAYAAQVARHTLKPGTERERDWAVEEGQKIAKEIANRYADGQEAAREVRRRLARELIDAFRRRGDVTRRAVTLEAVRAETA